MPGVNDLLKVASLCAAVSLGLATSAHAATIDFSNITSPGNPIGPFGIGSTTVTVTADTFFVDSQNPFAITINNDPNAAVTVTAEGLGVDNDYPSNDSNNVDGYYENDILLFELGTVGDLQSINFDNVDPNDDFVFFAVDSIAQLSGPILSYFFDIDDLSGDEGEFTFSPAITGRIFGIGALQGGDNFRVEGLTVTAVPVPAALPLFATGAGIIGFLGWRRRRKAQAVA